jgi:hypothetical protein
VLRHHRFHSGLTQLGSQLLIFRRHQGGKMARMGGVLLYHQLYHQNRNLDYHHDYLQGRTPTQGEERHPHHQAMVLQRRSLQLIEGY